MRLLEFQPRFGEFYERGINSLPAGLPLGSSTWQTPQFQFDATKELLELPLPVLLLVSAKRPFQVRQNGRALLPNRNRLLKQSIHAWSIVNRNAVELSW